MWNLNKIAISSKLPADWDIFHEAQRVYTHELRKASRDSYKKMTSEPPDLKDMSGFIKMVNSSPAQSIGVMQRPDGSLTDTPQQSLDVVLDKCFPESDPIPADCSVPGLILNSKVQ